MAKIVFGLLLTLLCVATAWAQDGSPDLTFGNAGTLQTDIDGENDVAYSIAEHQNGLVVGGVAEVNGDEYPVLVRYLDDGAIDTSFGDNGMLLDTGTANAGAYILVAEHENATILAGNIVNFQLQLTRFLPNGALDTNFANNGVFLPLADGLLGHPIVLNDHKIMVVAVGDQSGMLELITQRYLPNGTTDSSYGSNGIATSPVGLATSGTISGVVASEDHSLFVVLNSFLTQGGGYQIVKLNMHGEVDSNYGNFGVASTLIDPDFSVPSVTLYPDGKIALVGSKFFPEPERFENKITQHLPNGQVNTAFASGGILEIPDDNLSVRTIIAQPNGRLLLYGELTDFFEGGGPTYLRRYFEQGDLDPSLSVDTVLNLEYFASTMILQGDGKIVCLGTSAWYNGDTDFIVERYSNNPLGIEEPLSSSILVSPNPSNGIFTLSFQGAGTPNTPYHLYDVSGKTIRTGELSAQHTSVDISEVASGIYFLNVQGSVYRLLKI